MLSQAAASIEGRSDQGALDVVGLSKSFAGNPALSSVDLNVGAGEVHVLVGQNGSGKSTLIKVLSGYHTPDPGGLVRIGGQALPFGSPESSYRLGCRFVHQDLGLVSTTTILDNLLVGTGYPTRWGSIRKKAAVLAAREALAGVALTVSPLDKVSTLGPAQRTELAVARALLNSSEHPPKVLVLDEPTATLPVDEVAHLLDTIRTVAASGVGILYVTHHLDEVFEIANRVTVLRDGRRVATSSINKVDRRVLVEQLVGGEFNEVQRQGLSDDIATKVPILEILDITAGPLRSVSFVARPGEVIGLAGLTGSGRETVLGAIFGAVAREQGQVLISGTALAPARPDLAISAGVAYMPGDRKLHGGIMPLSARENLTISDLSPFWSRLIMDRKKEVAETESWFSKLEVRPAKAYKLPLANFSGGNQQKILFGKWLRQGLPVFLLDEPTQGVDVGAKSVLHRQLLTVAEGGTAVIISSTDVDELAALCSRVLVFKDGRIQEELCGDQVTENAITHSIMAEVASTRKDVL